MNKKRLINNCKFSRKSLRKITHVVDYSEIHEKLSHIIDIASGKIATTYQAALRELNEFKRLTVQAKTSDHYALGAFKSIIDNRFCAKADAGVTL